MKKIVIIAIFLAAISSVNAQNQIKGRVLEFSSEGKTEPIFGANVFGKELVSVLLQTLMVTILLMKQSLFQLA